MTTRAGCPSDIRKARPGLECLSGRLSRWRNAGGDFRRRRSADRAPLHDGGKLALFSHGQFGLALAARWIGLPIEDARHFLLDTASVSILSFNPVHPDLRVIRLWNATPALLARGTD